MKNSKEMDLSSITELTIMEVTAKDSFKWSHSRKM